MLYANLMKCIIESCCLKLAVAIVLVM